MPRHCLASLVRPANLALVAALALGAFGCSETKRAPSPAAEASPAAAPATTAEPEEALTPKQKLALARLPGVSGADKMVTEAQQAARRAPGKDDLWVALGQAWVRKARQSADPGFYLNADACADIALERVPDHKLALDLKGLVLLNGHRFEDARALAERVVAAHPEDPMAYGTLSDAFLELGRYDEATAAAQRMVDLKPNLPSYSRASYLQWLRGDVVGAKQTARSAIDAGRDTRDPEPRSWVLVQAAMIFLGEGDVDGADAGFDKALEKAPEFAPALVGKGRVAMAKKDYARAAELFSRAHTSSPLVETAWLLGDARAKAGDDKGAAEAYAIVERDGKRTDPRTLSLFLSTKDRSPEEALRLAREEYEARKDVVTEDALAWALFRAGKIKEAKASITRARRLGTKDARLMYHHGAILVAAGEVTKGKKLVAEALALWPTFDATGAAEARALLDERVATR